jgi:regulator of sigma E protease
MNFLQQVFIFILFLGPLVFFHELGHFLFARFFGVKVEVFSIGFGPKLFKKKWGDTEYALSLIPLGGYVKMFGDDPLKKDEIVEEERQHSFTFKGKWARFWIVLGGPLANFILAYFIFFTLNLFGEKVPEIKVGHLTPENILYEKGMRSGDTLKKVNGEEIQGLADVAFLEGKVVESVIVVRGEQEVEVKPALALEDFLEKFSMNPPLLEPYFVHESGKKFKFIHSEGYLPFQEMKPGTYQVVGVDQETKEAPRELIVASDVLTELRAQGFYPFELLVNRTDEKFPAYRAGIRAGDLIAKVNGETVYKFETLRKLVGDSTESALKVSVIREGKELEFSMTPDKQVINDKEVKIIGVENSLKFFPVNYIKTSSKGFFGSITNAVTRTWDSTGKVAEGFKKLISREVSIDKIGGPLAIGKVASDSFNVSITMFLVFMALVSINLGLINLFPIPVLDGGHIMFIFLEIINRGPLSRRKMEIAQQVGLSLLLLLMFFALKNDFQNFIRFS